MSTKTPSHFDYMFATDDKAFFGKVAAEMQIDEDTTALRQALDADIQLLKTAGPVGGEFEMTKRALAYLSDFASEENPNLRHFPLVLEKVAAAALKLDVMAILPGLDKTAREELLAETQAFIKRAEETKFAGGAMSFLKGIGEAGKVVSRAPVAAAAKTLQKGVRGLEDARMGMAARGAMKAERSAVEARGAVGAAKNPVSKAFREGKATSLESSAATARASRDNKLTSMVGSRAKPLVPKPPGAAKVETAAATKAPEVAKAKAEAPAPAPSAATGPEAKAEKLGLIDTFKKMKSGGWASLSETEQHKMMIAGLGGAVAANTLMN